jgi:hypothetical protein
MNVWEWVEDYQRQAKADGDKERYRLTTLHADAYNYRETNPDRALALFEEGRRLALALHEPWWVLFFDHWRATAMLHFQRDYRTILDLAVRTTLEVRKPLYEQHPLRLAIFDDLIAAYLCIDPRGYAGPIQQALDYLQAETPAGGESLYMLQARQRAFAIEMGRLDEALAIARRSLAMADADPDRSLALHHSVFACSSLCKISFRRSDWKELGEQAILGEDLARRRGHRLELSLFLAWQALWSRHEGEEEQARRQCRLAMAQISHLGMPPTDAYYDALCAYHDLAGDLAAALRVRTQELQDIEGKGALASEAECRLKRCRLQGRMGKLLAEELEAARQASARLRDPAPYLTELDRLAAPPEATPSG